MNPYRERGPGALGSLRWVLIRRLCRRLFRGLGRPAACLLICAAHAVHASEVDALQIERFFAALPAQAAAAVIVLDAGERVSRYHAGAAYTGPPVDGHALFEIGSVTKTFTASVLAQAVANGDLALDDPIERHLSVAPRALEGEPVRLRHLLTHSAGLDPAPFAFLRPWLRSLVQAPGNPYRFVTLEHYLGYLDGALPETRPGLRWRYDNAGYGLLGAILARQAGLPWSVLVERQLLRPLGMNATRFEPPDDDARVVPGVDEDGARAPYWRMDFMAPAGAMLSTADDMTRWLRAQLRPPAGMAFLCATQVATSLETAVPGHRMAHGWLIAPAGWLWHNGGTGGHHAFVGFDPARQRAVVILTNVSQAHPALRTDTSGTRVNRLGFALMAPKGDARDEVSDRCAGSRIDDPR